MTTGRVENQDPFKLPEFPTVYTEQDAARKASLDAQMKSLSEVYASKFTSAQWEAMNPVEKGARGIIANTPWLDTAFKVLTPEDWGFDLGNQETAQQRLMEMQQEILDLNRRELVTSLLPDIKMDLRIAALAGQPITDMQDLLRKFPELNANFTDEEKKYIAQLASMVANASLDDVASGRVYDEFTEMRDTNLINGLKAFFAEQEGIQPGLILSTVAFTQNSALINKALKAAFPPSNVTVQEKAALTQAEEAIKERQAELDNGDVSAKHQAIADEVGELTVLADTETGLLIPGNKHKDNSVRVGGQIIGYVDPNDPEARVGSVSLYDYVQSRKIEGLTNLNQPQFQTYQPFESRIIGGVPLWEFMSYPRSEREELLSPGSDDYYQAFNAQGQTIDLLSEEAYKNLPEDYVGVRLVKRSSSLGITSFNLEGIWRQQMLGNKDLNPIIRFSITPVLGDFTPADIVGIGMALYSGGSLLWDKFGAYHSTNQYKAMQEKFKSLAKVQGISFNQMKKTDLYKSTEQTLKSAFSYYKAGMPEAAEKILSDYARAHGGVYDASWKAPSMPAGLGAGFSTPSADISKVPAIYTAGMEDWAGWQAPGYEVPGSGQIISIKDVANNLVSQVSNQVQAGDSAIDDSFSSFENILGSFQLSRWLKANSYMEIPQEVQDNMLRSIMRKPSVQERLGRILESYKAAIQEGKPESQAMLENLAFELENIINQEGKFALDSYLRSRGRTVGEPGGFDFDSAGKLWDEGLMNKIQVLKDAGYDQEAAYKLFDREWGELNDLVKAKVMKVIKPKPITRSLEQEIAREQLIQSVDEAQPASVERLQQEISSINGDIQVLARDILVHREQMSGMNQESKDYYKTVVADMEKQLAGLIESKKNKSDYLLKIQQKPVKKSKLTDQAKKQSIAKKKEGETAITGNAEQPASLTTQQSISPVSQAPSTGIESLLDTDTIKADLEARGLTITHEIMDTPEEQRMFDDMERFVYGYYGLANQQLSTPAINVLSTLVKPCAEHWLQKLQANPNGMYHDETWRSLAIRTLEREIPGLSGNRNERTLAITSIVSLTHQQEQHVMHDLFNMTDFPSLDVSDEVMEQINTIFNSIEGSPSNLNIVPNEVAQAIQTKEQAIQQPTNPVSQEPISVEGGTSTQRADVNSWINSLPTGLLSKVQQVKILTEQEAQAQPGMEEDMVAGYSPTEGVIYLRGDNTSPLSFYHEIGHAIIESDPQAGLSLLQEYADTFEIRKGITIYRNNNLIEFFDEAKADNQEWSDGEVLAYLAKINEVYGVYEEDFVESLGTYLSSGELPADKEAWFSERYPQRGSNVYRQGVMVGEVQDRTGVMQQSGETTSLVPSEGAGIASYWDSLTINERMELGREAGLVNADEIAMREYSEQPADVRDWIEGEWGYLDEQRLIGEGRGFPDNLKVPVELDIERYFNEGEYAARNNPTIMANTQKFKKQQALNTMGMLKWNTSTNQDRAKLAKEMNLPATLAGKGWDDLTTREQALITMGIQPDNSFHMPTLRREWVNIYEWFEMFEEQTNLPFTRTGFWAARARSEVNIMRKLILMHLEQDPAINTVRKSGVGVQHVEAIINARYEGLPVPPGVTADELYTADVCADVYKSMEPYVRYLRISKLTNPDMDAMRKEFPDAVADGFENELEDALFIHLTGNKDALWTYVQDKTWGVIKTGYDPRVVFNPSFRAKNKGIASTIGENRLHRRSGADIPEDLTTDYFTRMASYVKSILTQFLVEPILTDVESMWFPIASKYDNRGYVRQSLNNWSERLQGVPTTKSGWERAAEQVAVQAMKTIFSNPGLALRNTAQTVVYHPEHLDLTKALYKQFPAEETEMMKFFFDSYGSNFGGIQKNWLDINEGTKELGIFKFINKALERITWYDFSDYLPRLHSFKASYIKATNAMKVYMNSQKTERDLQRYIKNSGLISLRKTEQNYLLRQFMGNPEMEFPNPLPGLTLTGEQLMSLEIAKRITDRVSGQYNRWERGLLEMSSNGLNYWSLIVYPRMVAQNFTFEAEHIKNAFQGEENWDAAKVSFKHIMTILATAQLAGAAYYLISGKKRNPWDVVGAVFGWTFGGLVVGMLEDSVELISSIVMATPINLDEESRKESLDKLPSLLSNLGESVIPFLAPLSNVLDSAFGKEDIIASIVRGTLDTKNPIELEDKERNLWEAMRNAVLGWDKEDTDFEKLQAEVREVELNLGIPDRKGTKVTTKQLGQVIETSTKGLPDAMLTPEEGWSDLTDFYLECRSAWQDYYAIPANNREERETWRKENLVADAQLIFWGKEGTFIYPAGGEEFKAYETLFSLWMEKYQLSWSQLPKADFTYQDMPPRN